MAHLQLASPQCSTFSVLHLSDSSWRTLQQACHHRMRHAYRPGTQINHQVQVRRYYTFCRRFHLPDINPTPYHVSGVFMPEFEIGSVCQKLPVCRGFYPPPIRTQLSSIAISPGQHYASCHRQHLEVTNSPKTTCIIAHVITSSATL